MKAVPVVRSVAPGVALCAAIAVPCWFLGLAVPLVGAPVFCILAGMVIALFWTERTATRATARAGIAFTSKKVLQAAVVLLGFGLNLAEIVRVGALSLPIIVTSIAAALVAAFVMCKALKIPSRLATLIGVGSSICGGSAIAATAPVIKADDKEVAQAISVVFLFNVAAALLFPTLGQLLGMSNEGFAVFAGTAVNDTSSVTAAAAVWDGMHPGAHALDQATVVKLTRTLAIIPITFVLALWTARAARRAHADDAGGGFSLKRSFPLFILFFVLASCVTTAASLAGMDPHLFDPLKTASKFLIVMAMAAIGLNTDVRALIRKGGPALALGLCCWVAVAATSLGMQHVLGLW